MMDVCELLGVKKLNTTAYHPQCNGMVERFN
jgi:transposase InsO family protein